MPSSTSLLQADACYLALKARDARFDGRFFTGVTSTGIYCRPVCRVKTPRPENCRFFGLAAQAEGAGFRPCLRCRPELAPNALAPGQAAYGQVWSIQDASRILAQQAARLMDEPEPWLDSADRAAPAMAQLAARLGVSDRHLRRLFEAQWGVSPLQYLQTRRLLTAKQLLSDTRLPIAHIAHTSGYASVRRFNAAFVQHYRLNPTQLRRAGATQPGQGADPGIVVRLGYRPPYDAPALLGFFRTRQIQGVEWVDPTPGTLRMARTLRLESAGAVHTGWLAVEFDEPRCQLVLRVSESLGALLPLVIRQVRGWLDLDAEPVAINAVLHARFPGGDGLRVPGCMDGFELAVRAVLGQQITVAAARTLAQRLMTRFGTVVETPFAQLTRCFPTPAALAQAEGDALGQLGIVRQRQAAIVAIARAVSQQGLALHSGVDVPATMAALKALPGIGDWTAHYIAMRALRWPDAFPAGDVALHKALAVQGEKSPHRAAEAASQAWKPWRSYAVIRAWSAMNPVKEAT
ncbi:MAG: DNA-3-methyladenine glycosylase 2 family protein [Burkholderiales bacterium]